MKIQLSPTRVIKGVMTVWYEPGPEVDLVMDLKRLTFAENSLDAIYTFHVLDHIYVKEVMGTMENWYSKLKPGSGVLLIVVNDYEFIARSFIGGDIDLTVINDQFSTPIQFTRESLMGAFTGVGFTVEATTIWFDPSTGVEFKFNKEPFELALSSIKK